MKYYLLILIAIFLFFSCETLQNKQGTSTGEVQSVTKKNKMKITIPDNSKKSAGPRVEPKVEPKMEPEVEEVSQGEAQGEAHGEAETLYREAFALYRKREFGESLSVLRDIRIKYPETDLMDKVLLLSARSEMELGESFRARYFLKQVLATKNDSSRRGKRESKLEASLLLGRILKKERMYDEALQYYRKSIHEYRDLISPEDRSLVYLDMTEILFYFSHDRINARNTLRLVDEKLIGTVNEKRYLSLKKYLLWENISKENLSISDGNISALAVDGDDLWVGTWNGGIARYSLSSGKVLVFRIGKQSIVPRSVRTIWPAKKRVWVGGFNGLSYYSKRTGKWYDVDTFGGPIPIKVESVVMCNNTLYAGTLGSGLWKLKDNKWIRILKDSGIDFINTMKVYEEYILIGTMDAGLFIFDTGKDVIINFVKIYPTFRPKNITTILVESDMSLWIGTYGEGLYNWDRRRNSVKAYTVENGMLGEDWILCSVKGVKGLYFGTFGGGVIRVPIGPKESRRSFTTFRLEDGLASMDISSAVYSNERLFFGTLGMGISIFYEAYE